MTYTSHGHHIPDSPNSDETEVVRVARCGGPGLCSICSIEMAKWAEQQFLQDVVNREAMAERMGHTEAIHAARYQTKPAEIVAVQYNGGTSDGLDIVQWIKNNGGQASYIAPQAAYLENDFNFPEIHEKLDIMTDTGLYAQVHPGFWVIQGTAGEFYPCPPDVFANKYEPKE